MEKIVDRVVRTYSMMVNLTAEDEQSVRDRVLRFIEGRRGDENALAVEAIKYLRGPKPCKTRRPK